MGDGSKQHSAVVQAQSIKEQYEQEGYVVVDSGVDDLILDLAKGAEGPLQPKEYHWSDGPRVFEGWKKSQAVRNVAWAPGVMAALPGLERVTTRRNRLGIPKAVDF